MYIACRSSQRSVVVEERTEERGEGGGETSKFNKRGVHNYKGAGSTRFIKQRGTDLREWDRDLGLMNITWMLTLILTDLTFVTAGLGDVVGDWLSLLTLITLYDRLSILYSLGSHPGKCFAGEIDHIISLVSTVEPIFLRPELLALDALHDPPAALWAPSPAPQLLRPPCNIYGDFACRWRVKGAQPLPSVIRRDSTSAKSVLSDGAGSASGSGSGSVKEKARAKVDSEIEVQVHPPSPPLNPTRGSVSTIPSLNSGRSTPSDSDGKAIGSPLLQPDDSGSLDHGSDMEDALRGTFSSITGPNSSGIHAHSVLGPGRGRTPTVPIADHTVRWDELVEMAVPMGISKDTRGLMPADLKLTIEQVPQSHELVKPRAALGIVRLNLAEYAGKGPVTRRYLLRESKTNATLKLTIEVKWLSGEQDYVAPQLQKAQIMEGVAGLMSHDRILPSGMRTPTRLVPSPTQSFTSLTPNTGPDLLAAPGLNRGRAASLSRTPTLSQSLSHSRSSSPQPTARTEQIIEALFNPVPTTNPNPSPFAYYAPARPPVRRGTANVSAGSSELDSSWSIIKAQQEAQARALLQPSVVPSEEVGSGEAQGQGWWKRTLGKNARRPTTAV
ncbi:hypothetical protein OPQ81_003524 [Rhizoctonia solani]|nr:hypothetical protein OPQ81_003524 [Rhizoctonia solani]